MRSRSSERVGKFDNEIISLPVRLGGLGLRSHINVAPLARQAWKEMAASGLGPLLDEVRQDPAIDNMADQP